MSKYLVTGGAGFIGSNIAEELVLRGEFVRVLDNMVNGKEENLALFIDKIEFQKGDIRNSEDVKKALEGVDYVIHQAALKSIVKSVEEPIETNDVNVNGTLNLLVLAREMGIKRLVYASSSAIYGDCEEYPLKETLALDPISPYAVSKLTAEYYCRMMSATMGFETVSLRYFNVFGPRQNPESMYSAVIPAFISKLMNDEACPVDGDGEQSRDFIFVKDIARANIEACTAEGVSGMYFNLANGKDYSINLLSEIIKKGMNKEIDNVYGPAREGDIRISYADISKIKDKLKFEPKTDFEDGLEKTVKWFMESYKKL